MVHVQAERAVDARVREMVRARVVRRERAGGGAGAQEGVLAGAGAVESGR